MTVSVLVGQGYTVGAAGITTATIFDPNQPPTGTVTISGNVTQGQTLTAANTLADVDGIGTLSYQWFAGGVTVSGATGSNLVLAEAQVGKAITVAASYTDGHGTAESVTSAATAAVVNVNDAATGAVSISGVATQGQTLTAANTLADLDGLGAITYQWKADDTAIATGSALVLGEAQVGKAITLIASYIDGHGTAEAVTSAATAAVVNVNDLPTGSMTIAGVATQGQTLTAANTLADIDGLGAIAYQWQAAGSNISGSIGGSFVLTEAQVGKAITVVASYIDGHGMAESVTSPSTAAVANINDPLIGKVTISGTATQGQTLTATNTLADLDGLGTITYQWRADGTNVAIGSVLVLGDAQVGKTITLVASYTDGHGTAEAVTSAGTAAVVNVNDLPTGSVTISGVPTQGQTLTAANTLADIDGLVAIAYQWQAAGTNISGANGSSLVLIEAQVSKAITVVASYTDGHGTAESVPSLSTTAVVNVNDAATGAVTISGVVTQGQTLTATNTLADIDGLGAITYQWRADGINIANATRSALLLDETQVGKTITVVGGYTDGHGTAESVSSAATTPVVNVNDPGSVFINGTMAAGQTLTAVADDADGLGPVSYQWFADAVVIGGATTGSFLVSAAQVGHTIAVTAKYTDLHGTAESVSGGIGKAVGLLAYSWKAHTLLDAVDLSVAGHTASTTSGGTASLTAGAGSTLDMTAARGIPSAEGTATSQSVNLQDAIAILKMIVGLDVNGAGKALSPYQAYAADFDGNGKVELSDAIAVLKHVVGLPSPAPQWLFFNEADTTVPGKANLSPGTAPALSADMSPAGPVHVGLVGVLRGDVDGSYSGGGAQTADLNYFQLLAADKGLNLSQFGVYP